MNTRALFVSDIHITAPDDPRAVLFSKFLDNCLSEPLDHLFLVGDIFDFWIADRDYLVEMYADIIAKIRRLVEKGVRVHYFEGNHDLDLHAFWQHKLGTDVHSSAAFFHIGDFTVRVEHGDQMDPDDRGYLFLRWLLRTPPMVWLGRVLPERAVRWLGARASAASREYTSEIKTASDEQSRGKVRNHAARVYGAKAFDLFVSGHLHVSEDSVQVVGGRTFRCVNLGTWLKEPLMLEINGSTVSLREVPH